VTQALPAAGLLRRLAAVVYDGLLVLALWMVVTAAFLPFTGGEAVQASPVLRFVHRVALVAVTVGFFGVFWTRRGQTLGMASWRLQVERCDGGTLSWRDTVVRLGAAVLSWLPLGMGWWWALADGERRTWHDALSRTRVVVLPKRARRGAG
jgi:uncharacterized RDD family membrane protein YckC